MLTEGPWTIRWTDGKGHFTIGNEEYNGALCFDEEDAVRLCRLVNADQERKMKVGVHSSKQTPTVGVD